MLVLLIPVNQLKSTDYKTNFNEIKKKIIVIGHRNKYIMTQECNKLASKYIAATLKQAKFSEQN